jgi:hypothetical protein
MHRPAAQLPAATSIGGFCEVSVKVPRICRDQLQQSQSIDPSFASPHGASRSPASPVPAAASSERSRSLHLLLNDVLKALAMDPLLVGSASATSDRSADPSNHPTGLGSSFEPRRLSESRLNTMP